MTFIHRASKSHRRRLSGSYIDLVLGTGPIGFWPQRETSGTVAHCLVEANQNGAYTGVTLASDTTGPFGTPAPFYDGANDYCDIRTSPLEDQFGAGGGEWSTLIWWKVANAGVWTDGITRRLFVAVDSATDLHRTYKDSANNTLITDWTGGGVSHTDTEAALSTTGWNCTIITRSEADDEVKYYRNAALLATDTVIGNWGSVKPFIQILIGANNQAPSLVWHGWLGPAAFFPRALPLPTIKALSLA